MEYNHNDYADLIGTFMMLLLLMLLMRNVLATACCRFGSGGLVIKLNFCSDFDQRFGQDFEVEVQARFEAGVCSEFCC